MGASDSKHKQHAADEPLVPETEDAQPIGDELALLRAENHRLRVELAQRRALSKDVSPVASPSHLSPQLLTPRKTMEAEFPTSPARRPPVRLSTKKLPVIEECSAAEVPTFKRFEATHWILHIGLGGFSRSHLCMLTDTVLALQAQEPVADKADARPKWGICGVGLMPWDIKLRDALLSQDLLYTILCRDSVIGDTARIIGSIMDYIFVPEDPTARIERLADPSTKIVSLTVTEKGYCTDSTGGLDMANKLIQHDIGPGGLDAPQSAPGFIVAGLKLRRDRGIPPFVIMSCDNLPMNGMLARRAVTALANHIDTSLGAWIASPAVCFPSCMVDRITPMTTEAEKDILKDEFGVIDEWPVVAEPFVQWVLEDAFGSAADARPPWELCSSVQFVPDVKPYELMKLRLLNSSHSALGYAGILAGYKLVHEAMGDPLIRSFITRYMAAVAPTVPPVPGVNLNEYQEILVRRFSNSRISDTLARLAQDGSQKWSSTLALGGLAHSALGALQFAGSDILADPPLFTKYIRNNSDLQKLQQWRQNHRRWRKLDSKGARGEFGADVALLSEARPPEPPPPDVALALAGWVRYMTGVDEQGEPIKLEDPCASALQPLARRACGSTMDVEALAQVLIVALGESAASWPQLIVSVARWLVAIKTRGMVSALAEALAESPTSQAIEPALGADHAIVPGSSSAQSRLAVLKLRQRRLQAESEEVSVQLEVAKQEAIDEMERIGPPAQRLGTKKQLPRQVSGQSHQSPILRAVAGSAFNLQHLSQSVSTGCLDTAAGPA